ncbi:hypothetical protein LINGRAHAP2_LOCUS13195 [Linum grandiflorum]
MGDCECPYYHRSDRVWSPVPGLGDRSAGMGGWTIGVGDIRHHRLVHIHPPR